MQKILDKKLKCVQHVQWLAVGNNTVLAYISYTYSADLTIQTFNRNLFYKI